MKNQKEKEFIEILINLSDDNPDSNTEGPTQEWKNAVDRGDLTHITTDAIMEIYKQEQKCTVKSKSLHSKLFTKLHFLHVNIM